METHPIHESCCRRQQSPSPFFYRDIWSAKSTQSLLLLLALHAPLSSSDEEEMRNPARRNYGGVPPPISCIGKRCLQPIRQNGRFILTEMRISTQEYLHACRENGRLKVHVVHSDEEEEEEEDDVETIHGTCK